MGGHTGPMWTHTHGLMAVVAHRGTLWTGFHPTLDQVSWSVSRRSPSCDHPRHNQMGW